MTLRQAEASDAPAIAALLRRTLTSLRFLPTLHTPDEDLAFIRDTVLPDARVWVAEADGAVVGFIADREGWIDHLYVAPETQGQGAGARLLAQVLADGRPRQLWTFQRNDRARRFYEARGFRLVRLTDGSANEEKEPDALYLWPGSSPPTREPSEGRG